MNIDILDPKGKKAGSIELPADIFDVDPNIPLMHQVVVAQLAAARQGTHATKTRGQVRGGGRKPWRQKGTGRARHGSIRSPQWRGGGVVFGPQPRSYKQRTPKKMIAAALRCALSDRARNDRIHAVESFIDAKKPSTKAARLFIEKIADNAKVLAVVENLDGVDVMSLRNLPQVHILTWGQLNTYDVLDADNVIFTKSALEAFIDARSAGKANDGKNEEASK
ncbi:MAG: 50S ribosomal protein L4 [Actinomycetaceae bacterium]|nr:50S ribosomal protein L4 [Actinomycetaceae bacterium]